MARPKVPLIAKQQVLIAALEILDEDGLEGLTVRRLAARIGVNNTSLYHHFKDKDEILAGVAELALAEIGSPNVDDTEWQDWVARGAVLYREMLVQHPALITIMQSRQRFHFALRYFDDIIAGLGQKGVPPAAALALIETLDELAIGSAIGEVSARRKATPPLPFDEYPSLRRALQERALTYRDHFEIGCGQLIEGIARAFDLSPARVR